VKGFVFTMEALIVLSVFLSIMIFFTGFFTFVSTPDFDSINSMAIVHDLGQANTSTPPQGFLTSELCTQNKYSMGVYQFGLEDVGEWGVCLE